MQTKCAGLEFHDLFEVRQKIRQAVVAGIRAILVLHSFFLQLFVESGGAFFETVVVILTAVEIDRDFTQGCGVSAREDNRIVLFPVANVDRISENRRQHLPQRRAGAGGGCRVPAAIR